MRILITEKNNELGSVLKASFEGEHFIVDWAKDFEKGAYLGRLNEYGAILIDAHFDNLGAREACIRIREKKKDVPLIVLSSLSGIRAKVQFFDIGADDHITKPFSFQELLARTKSIIKRPRNIILEGELKLGEICLNRRKHQVLCGGNVLDFSRKEFMLLELLMGRKGEVVSRSEIMENIWDGDADPFSNTIETHIASIRRKIRENKGGKPIVTVSGVGYKID